MISVGQQFTLLREVRPEHTADALGNPGMMVLGTPMLVSFAEIACHQLLLPYLDAGQGTVGTMVNIRHLKATPLGMMVTIVATLRQADRRRYLFDVEGHDSRYKILSGQHERFVIELVPFLASLHPRT
jgi:predicted thioesterase